MEAAIFMVILALPGEAFSTPVCITGFITRGPTMVFIIPGVFCGSSTQDLTEGALIRRFICGDFTKAFLTRGFTLDSVTTGSLQDFTAKRLGLPVARGEQKSRSKKKLIAACSSGLWGTRSRRTRGNKQRTRASP